MTINLPKTENDFKMNIYNIPEGEYFLYEKALFQKVKHKNTPGVNGGISYEIYCLTNGMHMVIDKDWIVTKVNVDIKVSLPND